MKFKMRISFSVIVVLVSISVIFTYATVEYDFNGGYISINNNGAAGTIETQNPYVYGSDSDNSVSAWVMTLDGSTSTRFAQAGWRKVSTWSSPKYFYEYAYWDNQTWYTKDLNTATTGSNNDFKVGCDSSTMYFVINDTSVGTVSLSTIPFSRNAVEIMGETHDTNDQCLGSVTNPVSIGNAQYKTTSNSWISAIYNKYTSQTLSTMKNNISVNGSTNWEIWDSRY
ncbi:MAG TPA: hypothetical protein VIK78_03345 [Ruminiclostridium sp.]